MIEIPSKEEFRAWLAERPTEVVGYACDSDCCPVATWLGQRIDDYVSVSDFLVVGADHLPKSAWPSWLTKFVERLDEISVELADTSCDGDFCISVLDRCE